MTKTTMLVAGALAVLQAAAVMPPEKFQRMSAEEREAAFLDCAKRDLDYHFAKMGAAKPEIAIEKGDVGRTNPEAFRLRQKDGRIEIRGRTGEALAYGIYRYLRELGCDWVMPGEIGEVIPKRADGLLKDGFDVVDEPKLARRMGWYGGHPSRQQNGELHEWLARMGQQWYRDPNDNPGGHAWSNIYRANKKEFAEHPEYGAQRRRPNGELTYSTSQIETTNPRVIEMAVEYIRKQYAGRKLPKDAHLALAFGPSDGGGVSISPETQAISPGKTDPESGSPEGTDVVVQFLNTLLERTAEEFPNLELGYYVYSWHAAYPFKYTPHPRLTAVIADINFSRLHGICDANSKTRFHYKDIIEQWGELHRRQGNRIWYRPYTWNLADTYLPFSKLTIWGEEIPWLYRQGVSVFNINFCTAWGNGAPHNYAVMRQAWDPEADWHGIFDDFCRAAYGKAAEPMKAYHLAIDARQRAAGQEAGSVYPFALVYDLKFADETDALLAKAVAVADDERVRTRIELFGLAPNRHLRHYLEFMGLVDGFAFPAADAKLRTMREELEKERAMSVHNNSKMPGLYMIDMYTNFTERAVACSTGAYSLVYRLPEKLKTGIDRDNTGEAMHFYEPAINDRDWIETKTYSSTWDAQGLSAYRKGVVWYRQHFDFGDKEAAYYGLFIGCAEDMAKVWLNGEYVGEAGPKRLRRPFIFDLTKQLKANAENVLVIKVTRSSNNELGTGGLMLPSFVFKGPEPVPGSGADTRPFEILPGGVIQYLDGKK